jgi:predicted alpha-1,2-mannosidase
MIVVSGCILLGAVRESCAAQPELTTSVRPGELGRRVNPFVGTGGISYLCGNNFPGATVPFGMVRLSPDTVSSAGRKATNTSGYFYGDERILGFSHTRLSGTGAVDGGNFLVVPSIALFSPEAKRLGLNARFSHDKEIAFPGYYAVALPEPAVLAELTATCRVGVHRYTFSPGQTPHLHIHVSSVLGKGRSSDAEVRILAESHEVEGAVRTFGTFSGRHGGGKVYFVARSSRPISTFGTWAGDSYVPNQPSATGDDVGADLTLESGDTNPAVELKVAISYVSIANARANLEAEAGQDNFDQVLAKAKNLWEQRLSLLRIEGGTQEQQTIFYTGLYHSFLMPTTFNDASGEYLGFDGQVHHASGSGYFTDMSLWDTFRTVHPLYCLIAPLEQRDMVVSLIDMARHGGYLPRWPSGAGYTNSMFGTPADIMIADTYQKGIRDFDVETAYQAMRKTALAPTPQGAPFTGRKGVEDYLRFEYCPADLMPQAVSRTLEYCYADHAIARLAEALGHREDAALFDKHAQYYRNLWNPETQYFQPRDSQGHFQDFRPLLLTYADVGKKYTDDYVEGSALQWRWAVSFDAPGLISLFKSREYFVQELDEFFAKSEPEVGVRPNAYYWHGNQPDIYAAYLFNAADRADLTQKWVRWILDKKYGDKENGLDGNDDGGTLSAWYVLSSLGLYPTAGSDRYQLTSPLWKRAEIALGNHRLTVVADNFAPQNLYIQKVWLNDTIVDRTWLGHSEIAQGGVLRFDMGPQPGRPSGRLRHVR